MVLDEDAVREDRGRSHRLVRWGHTYDCLPLEEDTMQFVLAVHHGTFPLQIVRAAGRGIV